MNTDSAFVAYTARLNDFIRRHASVGRAVDWQSTEAEFNELALNLFYLQYEHNPPYRGFCERRGLNAGSAVHWSSIPATPTAAFKELELTCLPPVERTREFHSSGTTTQQPSRHWHSPQSLAAYEFSLLPWFRAHVLSDLTAAGQRLRILCLVPASVAAPHSSLAYMMDVVCREYGAPGSRFVGQVDERGGWTCDHAAFHHALEEVLRDPRPVVLMGTAFSLVHWLDHLAETGRRYVLPPGSRVMETGGYKGRSRAVPKPELHALLTEFLQVPPAFIVCEYGMSELSSQAYDGVAGSLTGAESSRRSFRFPPWVRAQVISPETGREVAEGETGLLRVFDLANVASVLAIQTEDLAVRRSPGFELLGRATNAEPRGCSLMAV